MVKQGHNFNPETFFSTAGAGRDLVSFQKGQSLFAQGDASDAVFVVLAGIVRLSAKSRGGKEATLDILVKHDFVGKDSIADQSIRTTSAKALTDCQLLRIDKKVMMLALAQEVTLSNAFCAYLLTRSLRYRQDLVEQRCDTSEERLACILLRLAHLEAQGLQETTIPKIPQETLAEMVGTTRSRISFFLNKFRESGFIDYSTKSQMMEIHHSLVAICAQ
jgi:CRP-like cAMP-binding protein